MSQDKMIPGPASFSHSNISIYFFKEEKQKEWVVFTPLGLHSLTCVMAAMSCGPEWVTHREGYYTPGSPPSCKDPHCSRQAAHPTPVRRGGPVIQDPSWPQSLSPVAPLNQNPAHILLPHGDPAPKGHPLPLHQL